MLTNRYFHGVASAMGLILSLSAPVHGFTFTTGAINDADPVSTQFTTTVTGIATPTAQSSLLVTLALNLAHDQLSDLEIYLTDSNNNTLLIATGLSNVQGSGGSINATLKDGLDPNIDTSANPYSGDFTPSGSSDPQTFATLVQTISNFSGFNNIGVDPNGVWTLTIFDFVEGNVGTVNAGTTLNVEIVPIPFEFSPVTGLICLGALGLYTQWRKRK